MADPRWPRKPRATRGPSVGSVAPFGAVLPFSVLLAEAGLGRRAAGVSIEGVNTPLGKAPISSERKFPIEMAQDSTLLT